MDISSICAGIVTYNSNIKLLDRVIMAVSQQVDKVLVFDNSSRNITDIVELCEKYDCKLHKSESNKGIAYALNCLCNNAIQLGYSWILTLDHDTVVSEGMIRSFCSAPNKDSIGIICPRVNYVGVKIRDRFDVIPKFVEVPVCMTSGSFMNLSAWNETSHFDEWLFIDSVDNDICYQFKQLGYRILRDNSTFMEHNLGSPKKKKLLFFTYLDYQYPPFRLYYIVRNRIYLTKKYWRKEGVRFFVASIKIILVNFLANFTDKKRRSLILKGIYDGFVRKIK